jgi:hypothetical protein
LNVAERVALFNILPSQGNIVTLRSVKELLNKLAFTNKELKDWKIKQKQVDGGMMIVWDSDFTNCSKEYEINGAMSGLITEQLKEMSNQGRLKMEMLTLYEKFVEGTKEVRD